MGSDELRRVREPLEQWATRKVSPMSEYCNPPVLVKGRLHWRHVAVPRAGSKCNNMLVFDTVAESFRLVRVPVVGSFVDPFEMKGELGLYSYDRHMADLWVLEDYEDNLWSFKYRISLQRPIIFLVPDAQGDVFVTSFKEGTVAGVSLQCLKHLSGSVVTQHEWDIYFILTRHRFKESLVRHDFFPAEGNGGVDEAPLFHGLSTAVVLPDDNSELD
jgi:hypothetical protein